MKFPTKPGSFFADGRSMGNRWFFTLFRRYLSEAIAMGKLQLLAAGIVLLSFITALYFQPQLPERVAIHWNIDGKADGWSDSGFASYFLPVLMLGMLVLFHVLPYLDPLKKNYAAFSGEYEGMIAVLIGFMYYVYALSLADNLGWQFNMVQLLSPAFAALFYYMGVVIGKAKQNWFVGIKTPWTLSSKKVWDKTHALGGKLFRAAGAVALIGIIYPAWGLMAAVAMMIAAAAITFVYSYLEYKKEKT